MRQFKSSMFAVKTEILLGMLVLFAGLLSFSEGAPVKGESSNPIPPKRTSEDGYTCEEEYFIIKQLLSRGTHFYSRKLWKEMAEVHKSKVESGDAGFDQERSHLGLFKHFFQIMMKEKRKGPEAVPVPYSLKKLLEQKKYRYTPQEDAFIHKELLSYKDTKLSGRKVWKEIADKLKRYVGNPGFPTERSAVTLSAHYSKNIKSPELLPGVRKKKTATHTQNLQDASNQGSSVADTLPDTSLDADTTSTQSENMQDAPEDEGEYWAAMVAELHDFGPEIDWNRGQF